MREAIKWKKKEEAIMVREDFLFVVLLVIALWFARSESRHWKH